MQKLKRIFATLDSILDSELAMRKPYYRQDRKAWYVKTNNGKSLKRLHEDEKEAYKIWHEMQKLSSREPSTATMAVIAERFLRWEEGPIDSESDRWLGKVAPKTFRSHRDFLADACNSFGSELVRNLKPYHVTDWLEGKLTWGSESQRGAIAAVKRCLNWADEQGHLENNPLAKVKKPAPVRREGLITDEEHAKMMTAEDEGRKSKRKKTSPRHACFRMVLTALRQSGCRPGSICAVRIEDVKGGAWVLHQHKNRKKTGKPLIVYLSACLQTLTRLAAGDRKSGPLFLNSLGKKWTPNAIRCRMKTLRKKLGLPDAVIAYAFRHTFTTQALINGTPLATVAELIGNSDLDMIAKHYGHLEKASSHLASAMVNALQKRA